MAAKIAKEALKGISSLLGTNLDNIKKADGTPSKGALRNSEGKLTHLMGPSAVDTFKRGTLLIGTGAGGAGGAGAVYTMLSNDEEENKNQYEDVAYTVDDLPLEGGGGYIKTDKKIVYTPPPKFNKLLKNAVTKKEDTFEYKYILYVTSAVKEAIADAKSKKYSGGKAMYAEGSLMVPPEMEGMPEDTYDNIPPEEMAEAQASQLPDDEMEDGYLDFVMSEALDMEEQEYLMSVLETDARLNGIFDKVMDVAGEFSGEGKVDGPGTGVSDSIPARLSDGEFVFTRKATDQLGADQLQTMMDDAERAYDGGMIKSKMQKAFGGLTNDPMDTEKSYMNSMQNTEDEIKNQMIRANRTPSVYSNLG